MASVNVADKPAAARSFLLSPRNFRAGFNDPRYETLLKVFLSGSRKKTLETRAAFTSERRSSRAAESTAPSEQMFDGSRAAQRGRTNFWPVCLVYDSRRECLYNFREEAGEGRRRLGRD